MSEILGSCEKCEGDTGDTACVEGAIYGRCGSEFCYGACEYYRECDCDCHD